MLANGEIRDEAAGVLGLRTQVEATTDSVFKIGSITKIWTATLIQQLVDDGVLDLDRPVRDYLPGFRLSDPGATASLTARHLLTHTGGIDGNHFTDTGRNDDAIEKFVATLAEADQLLPPDTVFSYSNSGYVVLGRLVEVLRDKPFHDVLRDRLVTPLGLRTAAADPYEAILHRAAVGHVRTGGEVVPSAGVAVAVLTNSTGGEPLAYEIFDAALRDLAGVETAPLPVPPLNPTGIDVDRMCGTYRSTLYDITLTSEHDRAFLTYRPRNEIAESFLGGAENRVEVVRLNDNSVITAEPKSNGHQVLSLVGSDRHGRARFLHNGAAAYRIA
ncbi:serine hydrolase domain-containing protein [Nonomuraea sp. NPDC052265]|uniref:serine hydrolase domain-containing protein n=1 Tax=Nonomuraea sp. NPDC052265 TaxID=3364374 RepID=UPI0037C51CB0